MKSQQAFEKGSKGQENSSKSRFEPLKLVDNAANARKEKKLESDSESGSGSESESDSDSKSESESETESESESEPEPESQSVMDSEVDFKPRTERTVVLKTSAIANREVVPNQAANKQSTNPAAKSDEAHNTNEEQIKANSGLQRTERSESETDDDSENESGESETDESEDDAGEDSDDWNIVETEVKEMGSQEKDLKQEDQPQLTGFFKNLLSQSTQEVSTVWHVSFTFVLYDSLTLLDWRVRPWRFSCDTTWSRCIQNQRSKLARRQELGKTISRWRKVHDSQSCLYIMLPTSSMYSMLPAFFEIRFYTSSSAQKFFKLDKGVICGCQSYHM